MKEIYILQWQGVNQGQNSIRHNISFNVIFGFRRTVTRQVADPTLAPEKR